MVFLLVVWQHMNSRRHKDRLAGKPPKPKFTPHSKSQPSSSLAVSLSMKTQTNNTLSHTHTHTQGRQTNIIPILLGQICMNMQQHRHKYWNGFSLSTSLN